MTQYNREVEQKATQYRIKHLDHIMGRIDWNSTVDPNQAVAKINVIVDGVVHTAADCAIDAGYSGAHDDGGASRQIGDLASFLEGIAFATTGETTQYQGYIDKFKKENDPEYAEYMRLKEKFGK